MAVIGKIQYTKDGTIVRPHERGVADARISMGMDIGDQRGNRLTTDRGHTHIHVVEASGLTPSKALARGKEHLKKFFDHVEFVQGYRKIAVERHTGYTHINRNYNVQYEVIYAIEDGARTHRTVSPDEGQPRGTRVIDLVADMLEFT